MDEKDFRNNWIVVPECMNAVLPRKGLAVEQTSAFAVRVYYAIMLGFPWAYFLITNYKNSPLVLAGFSIVIIWLIMGILVRIRTYMAGSTLHSAESYTMQALGMDKPDVFREYVKYRKIHELEYMIARSKEATFKDEAAMLKLIDDVEKEIKESKNDG